MENVKEQLQDALVTQAKDFVDYDPIGMPDEKDLANIQTIIRNHELAHPGEMAGYVQQAKKERGIVELDKRFGQTKSRTMQRTLTMPTGLLRMIEEAYPLMFVNRMHLQWFKKNFPQFTTRPR